jgi:hypothetical protein
MEIVIALSDRARLDRIEGPTKAQAAKMARRRLELLDRQKEALSAGRDQAAFDLGCEAFDIETTLREYGYARYLDPAKIPAEKPKPQLTPTPARDLKRGQVVRASTGWCRIDSVTVNRGVVELQTRSTYSGRSGSWVGAAGQLWEVRSDPR